MLSINPVNSSNNPNFHGLTSQLKRRPFLDAVDILEKVEKYSKSNGIAGNLPHSWIEKLPLDKRGERIKDIYKEFGKAVATIENGLGWWGEHVIKPEQNSITNAEKIIASVLKKHGIVSDEEKAIMENIGEGTYGSVQKLKVNEEEFALKVFIPFKKIVESLTKTFHYDEQEALKNRYVRYLLDKHGINIEANRALYLNARQNSRFNKAFFFVDLNNGGMLSRFLDKTTRSPQNPAPLRCYGLVANGEELGYNSTNGVVYDYGGIILRKNNYRLLADNNTARRVYNQFRHTPQEKRQNRFDSFSKQYSKSQESWVDNLKILLQTAFKLH